MKQYTGTDLPCLAITTGEPAGIGPELCATLDPTAFPGVRLVLLGDARLLAERAPGRHFVRYRPEAHAGGEALEILDLPLAALCVAGQLDPRNAGYVLGLLDRAMAGCLEGEFAALVTAPLHKGVICEAGHIGFRGHTEYLAEHCAQAVHPVMLLLGPAPAVAPDYTLRVALATTHLPLRAVPDAIDRAGLGATLDVLVRDLRMQLGIAHPRVLVAGLNPHAGEGGNLGEEELRIIIPALEDARARLRACICPAEIHGPLPADTLFTPARLAQADAVLAMYHDQGLAVLKHASFGQGVNMTLGLPFVRTSVDHGTALDLAGRSRARNRADPGSLHAAIALAALLVETRTGNPR